MTSFPTNTRLVPKRIEFAAKTLNTSYQSMYTGKSQVLSWGGQYWTLNLTFPTLFPSDAEELCGFLNSLGGSAGTFLYKLPSKFLITSSQSLTMATDGKTFTGGSSVQVGKFGYSSGNRLVQFTTATTLFPKLPSGSTTVNNSAGAYFRLATDEVVWNVDTAINTECVIPLREVV